MDGWSLIEFKVSPIELIVRGSALYWFLFLVFRFVLRRDDLRAEHITVDELASQLRQHGVESPSQVQLAQMEGDGRVSVIRSGAGTARAAAEQPPEKNKV